MSTPTHPDNGGSALPRREQRDSGEAEALLDSLYNELRALAKKYVRSHAPAHTLQPTALVHEAYLRMVGINRVGRRIWIAATA